MTLEVNENGLQLGSIVDNWTSAQRPVSAVHNGQYCRIEPLSVDRHGDDLYREFDADKSGSCWTYLPYGPFDSGLAFQTWLSEALEDTGTVFFAIIDLESGSPVGIAAYLRIFPEIGTIEVGHLNFSLSLKRSRVATEAMFLMMQHAFQLGYRRYEWKCNALNIPSRAAAQRLGFSYEGVWRNAMVVKGRNRDTAWFSITDYDWPHIQYALQTWLSEANFDSDGKQILRLSYLTRPILSLPDPVLEIG